MTKLGLRPTVFCRSRKELFENGAAAFQARGRSSQQPQQERIEIQRKDEVLAELMGEQQIHAARDPKLEETRRQRQLRRQQAA